MKNREIPNPINRISFKNNDNTRIQNIIIRKLKISPITIPKDEKIIFFIYKTIWDVFIITLIVLSVLFSFLSSIPYLISHVDLIFSIKFPISTILVPIVFLLIFWNPGHRLLSFDFALFTDKKFYFFSATKKSSLSNTSIEPLEIPSFTIPYDQIRQIFFSKKRSTNDYGSIHFSFVDEGEEYSFGSIKNLNMTKRIILSIFESYHRPELHKENDNLEKDFSINTNNTNTPLTYKTSNEIVKRIEKEKKGWKRIVPLLFIVTLFIVIISIISVHKNSYASFIVAMGLTFLIIIPYVSYLEYKSLPGFINSDNSLIKILNNKIEIEQKNDLGINSKSINIDFRFDFIFKPDRLDFSNSKTTKHPNIYQKLEYSYLSKKIGRNYIGKIENVAKFSVDLNYRYLQWLKSQNYFMNNEEIRKKFLQDDPFNFKICSMLIPSSEDSLSDQINFGDPQNIDRFKFNLKYPEENIKIFFEKDETILYAYHPSSGKNSFLKPSLLIAGIILALIFITLILGIINHFHSHFFQSEFFLISYVIFSLIVGFYCIAIYYEAVGKYIQNKSLEILFTNKKLIIFSKNYVCIILNSNISHVIKIPSKLWKMTYSKVVLNLNNDVDTIPTEIKNKYILDNVPKDSPVFSLLNVNNSNYEVDN